MSAPSFRLTMPPRSLFNWPPDPYPVSLPPPVDARTFASPFPINAELYNAALDWKVPVTIGALYASTALIMNRINRERKNQPWAISKTTAFHYFVLAHNIFLAIFSALTFIGMIRALAHSWPGRRDLPFLGKLWPGLRTQYGLAGAADALCKLHGPRNIGDAVYYNSTMHQWSTTSRVTKLTGSHEPNPADVGRLWNEGLAFWGWWFYLSKFYEVLDTFIILAKGKRSSTLQTYHHTGAMACMWAGIRYMSPPIWMFAFINSGIHTLMYSYYTLSALRIRVPQGIKRTLTTMQITQFLVGITFATLHLFVEYSVPVPTQYYISKTVSSAAHVAASAVSAAASRAPEVAAAAAPSIGAFLKKLLLRAAGEEGMAQKVQAPPGPEPGWIPVSNATQAAKSEQETRWRTQYKYVPCIDTEGQAFAIWLNVFYLAPLTLLFVRFFIRSYSRRTAPSNKNPKTAQRIYKAAEDAAHGTNREVDKLGKEAEQAAGDLAQNISNKLQGSQTGAGSQRRVSAQIERIAKEFEKGEKSDKNEDQADEPTPERPVSSRSNHSSDSLKGGQIRKKPSAEHIRLRQKFEEGANAIGRSVDTFLGEAASKTKKETERLNLSPCAEDEEAERVKLERLEKEAEEKVRDVREAVGGQASRAAESIEGLKDGAVEQVSKLGNSLYTDDGEFSLVNVKAWGDKKDGSDAKDTQDSEEQKESESGQESQKDGDTKSSEASSPFDEDTSNADDSRKSRSEVSVHEQKPDLSAPDEPRSTTPSPDSSSPKKQSPSRKSKIPQPKNKRSASPIKKVLTPATTTASVAAHSGAAIVDKKEADGSTGN
ncbi:hypothetical protein BT63DRAFT_428593 [Microthyrium microscopicum]|uniref:Elongation of fatty acids protein n=1 Tax=Microthyrium microscopicum TaxID=703497 RepID=A0A6A6U2J4_9PEZI|nr:hypothetical protein BT63DRAFT_428593 [Microthyrium microscopicum]